MCVCVSSARIDHGTYVITIYTKIVGYHAFSNLGIPESLILSNFENENTVILFHTWHQAMFAKIPPKITAYVLCTVSANDANLKYTFKKTLGDLLVSPVLAKDKQCIKVLNFSSQVFPLPLFQCISRSWSAEPVRLRSQPWWTSETSGPWDENSKGWTSAARDSSRRKAKPSEKHEENQRNEKTM